MKITKIAKDKDGVRINYEQHAGKSGIKKTVLEEPDEPRNSFNEAMQALRPFFRDITGLPAEFVADFIVKSVSFKFNTKGNKSVIISASKPMEIGTPLNISTPSRMMDSEGDECKTQLDADAVIALEHLEDEAQKYMKGERSEEQDEMSLNGEEGEED